MATTVAQVWKKLERDAERQPARVERLYRALGASAVGIRAGYLPQQGMLELLIEVPTGWSGESVIPAWRGMGNEVVALGLPPREAAHHLRVFLVSPEHRDVFLIVCEDLVAALEGITKATPRVRQLEACLLRWRRFFERSGPDGLSANMQQGLFAELTWLKRLLAIGVEALRAVSSWKGCERGYHDFDLSGCIVEVKSTRTKEPKSVTISNERQLDERGLRSLHLYVLSVLEAEGGGVTLPERVDQVRDLLAGVPVALAAFQNGLISAGYLDRDAERYGRHLIIKSENLFHVAEDFPRIISLPQGVGDLRYRVVLAACKPFQTDLDSYLTELKER